MVSGNLCVHACISHICLLHLHLDGLGSGLCSGFRSDFVVASVEASIVASIVAYLVNYIWASILGLGLGLL